MRRRFSPGRLILAGLLVLAIVAGFAVRGLSQATVLPLGLPGLPFHVRIDALSAFFLLLLCATTIAISPCGVFNVAS